MATDLRINIKAVDNASPAIKAVIGSFQILGKSTNAVVAGLVAGVSSAATTAIFDGVRASISQTVAFGREAVEQFKQGVEELNVVGDAAERFGISAKTASALNVAAKLEKISFEDLASSIGIATKRLGEFVLTGGGPAAEAYYQLGIDVRDAAGQTRSLNELLPEISSKLAGIKDDAVRASIADAIFGKGYANAMQANLGKLDEFANRARSLGAIFTPEQIAIAKSVQESIADVGLAFEGVRAKIVEMVGPTVTYIMEHVAALVAALPDMLNKAVGLVRTAWGNVGEESVNAMNQLNKIGESFLQLIKVVVIESVKIIIAGIQDAFSIIGSVALSLFERFMFEFVAKPTEKFVAWVLDKSLDVVNGIIDIITDGAFKALELVGKTITYAYETVSKTTGTQWSMILEPFADLGVGLETAARGFQAIRKQQSDVNKGSTFFSDKVEKEFKKMDRYLSWGLDDSLHDAMKELSTGGKITEALKSAWSEIRPHVVGTYDAVDEVLGVTVAWNGAISSVKTEVVDTAETIVRKLPEVQQKMKEVFDPYLYGFWDGMKAGFDQLYDQARNTFEQGRQLTIGLAQSISSNLSFALVDAVSGVKSLGAAMREFASNTLKQLSQVITQMLIMRAIAGIGKSFFAGGSDVPLDYAGRAGVEDLPGLNSGGVIGRGGAVIRFAGGGMVPGPNTNRDIIPALLTPGEGVLNRRAMANLGGSRLAAMNRGEFGGGAGGGVVVNSVVNISGGSNNPEAVRKAAAQGVLDALSRSPALRGQFRAVLG